MGDRLVEEDAVVDHTVGDGEDGLKGPVVAGRHQDGAHGQTGGPCDAVDPSCFDRTSVDGLETESEFAVVEDPRSDDDEPAAAVGGGEDQMGAFEGSGSCKPCCEELVGPCDCLGAAAVASWRGSS